MRHRIITIATLICLMLWTYALIATSSPSDAAVKALEEKLKNASPKEKYKLLSEFSRANLESNPGISLKYAKDALEVAKELDNPHDIMNALNIVGGWHYANDQFPEAGEFYRKALDLEPYITEKKHIGNLLVNIGMVYWKLNDYDTAETYHTRALGLRGEANYETWHVGSIFNNLGLVAEAKGELSKGLDYYRKALNLYKKAGRKRGVGAALTNISNIYRKKKEYPIALKYLWDAIPIYNEIGVSWGVGNAYLGVGDIYSQTGQYEKAEKYFNVALQNAQNIKNNALIANIYEEIFNMHEAAGDHQKALEFHIKWIALKKKIMEKRNHEQLNLMKVKYEMEKKEQDILLLKKSLKNEQMIQVFLWGIVLLAVVLGGVILNRFHTKKKANLRLEHEETKYRSLFSGAGDAIFLMDGAVFLDCNEQTLRMFGVDHEEILGRTYIDFSPPQQPDGQNSADTGTELIRKTLSGERQRFYWRHIKKDGTPFDVVVSLTAIQIEGQNLVLAILHDMTARQQLEDQRIISAKLETSSLLAAWIAQDFNELLFIINQNLQQARKFVPQDHPMMPYLKPVERSARASADLIHQYLIISEKGFRTRKTAFIGDAIREASNETVAEFSSGSRCRLAIPANLWPVSCDLRQIKLAAAQIIRNAFEAVGDHGEVTVQVENLQLKTDAVPPLEEGAYVRVSILDNGKGIPGRDLAKIFDPYFSTKDHVTRKGLGMGLTIAQAIVKRHDGIINLTSKPGSGSVFNIYLPAKNNEKF